MQQAGQFWFGNGIPCLWRYRTKVFCKDYEDSLYRVWFLGQRRFQNNGAPMHGKKKKKMLPWVLRPRHRHQPWVMSTQQPPSYRIQNLLRCSHGTPGKDTHSSHRCFLINLSPCVSPGDAGFSPQASSNQVFGIRPGVRVSQVWPVRPLTWESFAGAPG